MPRDKRFGFRVGSSSARVHEFLKRHADARPMEISRALGIKPSTVAMAIVRLVQRKLYERPMGQPRQAKPKKSSPSPTEDLRAARAQFGVAATVGPSLRLESDPVAHATGTLIDRAGGVQLYGNCGPKITASEYSHQGSAVTPGSAHPWGYLGNFQPKRGG